MAITTNGSVLTGASDFAWQRKCDRITGRGLGALGKKKKRRRALEVATAPVESIDAAPVANPFAAPVANPFAAPAQANYSTYWDSSSMPSRESFQFENEDEDGQAGFFDKIGKIAGKVVKAAGKVYGVTSGGKKTKAPAQIVAPQPAPDSSGFDWKSALPVIGIGAVAVLLLMRRGGGK